MPFVFLVGAPWDVIRLGVGLCLHSGTVLFRDLVGDSEYDALVESFFRTDISLQEFVNELNPLATRDAEGLLSQIPHPGVTPETIQLVETAKQRHTSTIGESNAIWMDIRSLLIQLPKVDVPRLISCVNEVHFITVVSNPIHVAVYLQSMPHILEAIGYTDSDDLFCILKWYINKLIWFVEWESRYPTRFSHTFMDDGKWISSFLDMYSRMSKIYPDPQFPTDFTTFLHDTKPDTPPDTDISIRHSFTSVIRQLQHLPCSGSTLTFLQELDTRYSGDLLVCANYRL